MRKIVLGILLGVIAGMIDLIPMLFQNLTLDANLSAFSLWVITGFLIAISKINVTGELKGIIISFLVLFPSAILIGWKEPVSLVPIVVMTLILGAFIGYFIEKFGK